MSSEPSDERELFHLSLNSAALTTIVLLHGLFGSRRQSEHVAKHLSDHHLLIPDLPQHSHSRDIGSFSLALAADKVASLIRKHAHGGKAHVAGLSLGGFVTLELVRRHPEVVSSGWASGSAPLRSWQLWGSKRPVFMYCATWLIAKFPGNALYRLAAWSAGLLPQEGFIEDVRANHCWDLCEAGYREGGEWQHEAVLQAGENDVRVAAVAGGKQDPDEAARELARELWSLGKGGGKETAAYIVKDALHGWDLQFPELYANGLRAWVERRDLPPEYELLE